MKRYAVGTVLRQNARVEDELSFSTVFATVVAIQREVIKTLCTLMIHSRYSAIEEVAGCGSSLVSTI